MKLHSSWQPILRHLYTPEFQNFYNNLDKTYIAPLKENIFSPFLLDIEKVKVVILCGNPKVGSNGIGFYSTYPTKEKEVFEQLLKKENLQLENVSDNILFLNRSLTYDLDKNVAHIKEWENFYRAAIIYIGNLHPTIWVNFTKKEYKYPTYYIKNLITASDYKDQYWESIPISNTYNYYFNYEIDKIDEKLFKKINYLLKKTKNLKL
jgi:uracil DNA glycosylase